MLEIKTITLKKSVLGSLKAMGESNKVIADRFAITSTEVNDAMIEFGFVKSRKAPANKKGYVILTDDDVTIQEPTIQTNLIDSIDEAVNLSNSTNEDEEIADTIAEEVEIIEGFE
tara:strand:- start:770 stop:1114 length:345 start_codon:yes stop_codon:yes gene_type:complete